jgi:hypothetical protein
MGDARSWVEKWHGTGRGIDHRVFVLLKDDVDDDDDDDDDDVARIQMSRTAYRHY